LSIALILIYFLVPLSAQHCHYTYHSTYPSLNQYLIPG